MRRFILLIILCLSSVPAFADDLISASGRLDIHGVYAFPDDAPATQTDIGGRLKMEMRSSEWALRSWIEGGTDGSASRGSRDHDLIKRFNRVYQSTSPYIDIKELAVERSTSQLDLRMGVQRYAWGRLDEYPPNDLLNPWDYTQFLMKSLEDRKIGVPSVSATLNRGDVAYDAVWIPIFVPYRLPLPTERWSGTNAAAAFAPIPNTTITAAEPELPHRTIENGSIGLRLRHAGDIEWSANLYQGFDTRPVFKTRSLVIYPTATGTSIDPGYLPDFHKITSMGIDAAMVTGGWSIRAEAAYTIGRRFNIRRELWGYPSMPGPGILILKDIEHKSDAVDYGLGVDYRLFDGGTMIMQAQQTAIVRRDDELYDRAFETLLWVGLKAEWMNQKLETDLNIAYNPEHGDTLARAAVRLVLNDAWKASINGMALDGPPESLFGRFAHNDQVEAELTFAW